MAVINKSCKAVLLTFLVFGVAGLTWLGVEVWWRWCEYDVAAWEQCLPEGIDLSTEFSESAEPINVRGDRAVTTVRAKLRQIGAYCKEGVIYDRAGRKVFFLHVPQHPTGTMAPREWREKVWGKYQEEANRLATEGTVILMHQTHVPE